MPPEFARYLPPALEDVTVPAYVLDRDGRIRWLNAAAREIVGDAVGKLFTSVLDLDEARRAWPVFERNVRGAKHPDFSIDLTNADGNSTRVEISSVPLGPAHHAVGMFGLAVLAPGERRPAPKLDARLTPRQHEILLLLADGDSTAQIAEILFLSIETVRNHVRHILRRLGAKSRLEAVAIGRRDGLL